MEDEEEEVKCSSVILILWHINLMLCGNFVPIQSRMYFIDSHMKGCFAILGFEFWSYSHLCE